MALEASRPTLGISGVAPVSSFITPVILAMASTPLSARIVSTKCFQTAQESSCKRLEVNGREVRRTHGDQDDHDDDDGHTEDDGHAAAVLWAVPVDGRHEEQNADGGPDDMRPKDGNIKVLEGVPARERGRDGQIRNKQQSADDREEPALRACRRIDAAAIREVAADDHVVERDQTREAHTPRG